MAAVFGINKNTYMSKNKINPDLIKPLPKKIIEHSEWMLKTHPERCKVIERVLFLDPKSIYRKIKHKFDPMKRHQGVQMEDIFPKIEGRCACGCRRKPEMSGPNEERQWQRKWARDSCSSFANDVLSIINNYFGKPAYYISYYYGAKCCECEEVNGLELDHIVGVKHGGGGSWLSNYRWLCKDHHVDKTNKSFNRGKHKEDIQIKLIL